MDVELPELEGPEAEAWDLLFRLYDAYPSDWILVGAQMVAVHAARFNISRPVRTADTDVLIDIRALDMTAASQWLTDQGFELEGISTDGIGHRFVRSDVLIDLLSIDHVGEVAKRITVPPARTIEVPGGRSAVNRRVQARVRAGTISGTIPIPDWVGAIILKARAAVSIPEQREKHLRDLALLLGLPVDIRSESSKISKREKRQLREAARLLTDETLASVARSVDPRNATIALSMLIGE